MSVLLMQHAADSTLFHGRSLPRPVLAVQLSGAPIALLSPCCSGMTHPSTAQQRGGVIHTFMYYVSASQLITRDSAEHNLYA